MAVDALSHVAAAGSDLQLALAEEPDAVELRVEVLQKSPEAKTRRLAADTLKKVTKAGGKSRKLVADSLGVKAWTWREDSSTLWDRIEAVAAAGTATS